MRIRIYFGWAAVVTLAITTVLVFAGVLEPLRNFDGDVWAWDDAPILLKLFLTWAGLSTAIFTFWMLIETVRLTRPYWTLAVLISIFYGAALFFVLVYNRRVRPGESGAPGTSVPMDSSI